MGETVAAAAIREQISESLNVKRAILESPELLSSIEQICNAGVKAYRNGGKLMFAGNGGSAADSQHLAAELVSRFYLERAGLDCLALTTNSSVLTAIGNDYCYEQVFARQIESHGRPGDIFVGISTSGNSKNIIEAIQVARDAGVTVVGLTGADGGEMKPLCDWCICIPSEDTARIQESHILIGHILCQSIEASLFG